MAAYRIAAAAGVPVRPQPYRPVLRGAAAHRRRGPVPAQRPRRRLGGLQRAALVAAGQDRGPPPRALPGRPPRPRRAAAPDAAIPMRVKPAPRLARVARRGADSPGDRRRPCGRTHRTEAAARVRGGPRGRRRGRRDRHDEAHGRARTAPTCSCSTSTCRAAPSLPAIPELAQQTAVVVLTMQNDPAFAREALQSGALGYVLKEAADAELCQRGARRRRRPHLPEPRAGGAHGGRAAGARRTARTT